MLFVLIALSGCVSGSLPLFKSDKPAATVESGERVMATGRVDEQDITTHRVPEPADLSEQTLAGSSVWDDSVDRHFTVQCHQQTDPHVAIMLPLSSQVFGSAADSVLKGFRAAFDVQGQRLGLPLRIYQSQNENTEVVDLYYQAVNAGACAVVGPLTRNGVSVLARNADMMVPTLALNEVIVPDDGNLFVFGLSAESEARQVAQQMFQDYINHAVVVTLNKSLSKRMEQAFVGEFNALGGQVLEYVEFSGDHSVFKGMEAYPETAVFIAADAKQARWIRPYLPEEIAGIWYLVAVCRK